MSYPAIFLVALAVQIQLCNFSVIFIQWIPVYHANLAVRSCRLLIRNDRWQFEFSLLYFSDYHWTVGGSLSFTNVCRKRTTVQPRCNRRWSQNLCIWFSGGNKNIFFLQMDHASFKVYVRMCEPLDRHYEVYLSRWNWWVMGGMLRVTSSQYMWPAGQLFHNDYATMTNRF